MSLHDYSNEIVNISKFFMEGVSLRLIWSKLSLCEPEMRYPLQWFSDWRKQQNTAVWKLLVIWLTNTEAKSRCLIQTYRKFGKLFCSKCTDRQLVNELMVCCVKLNLP